MVGGRLTLMSLDGQMEKLSAVYAEKSDGELLGLFEQRDGLTEMAQQALTDVMRARGLSARDIDEPEKAIGGEVEERVGAGEVLAYLFHDAFEAREAIRVLTEAGIEHTMMDWHVVHPEMTPYPNGLDLGLVVARALGEAKMSYLWRDGSEHGSDLPDAETVAIEVNTGDLERAAQVVEQVLRGR